MSVIEQYARMVINLIRRYYYVFSCIAQKWVSPQPESITLIVLCHKASLFSFCAVLS